MRRMRIEYANIGFSDVRGTLQADYLIGVDADLRIEDGESTVYEEFAFPVVELAWSLTSWLNAASGEDFALDTMSADEPGIVTIERDGDGWVVYSSFTPDVRTSAVEWSEIDRCVRDFIAAVRSDLTDRGLNPDWIVGVLAR